MTKQGMNKKPQQGLFSEDFRSDKEKLKDDFGNFSSMLIAKHSLDLHYPELLDRTKNPAFFTTLKSLYKENVFEGAWSEELLEKSIMHTITHRQTLSIITVQENASIIKEESQKQEEYKKNN